MSQHTYIAIMAGGVGSRFWPASREAQPKQFLDILGTGKTLLRQTFERFLQLTDASRIYIVTNKSYHQQVLQQLPELGAHQILCEPSRNNTAPCVAYAAMKLYQLDPEANMVIAPSDHMITNEPLFIDNLRKCLEYAEVHDALLTLGIAPDRPHTGYGYIQFDRESVGDGIYPVARFTEKPPRATAEAFIASGDYLWNAGIFVWRAATVLEAYQCYAPKIYDLLAQDTSCYNTPREQAFIDEVYPKTPSISVDYAIMEKADRVYTLPAQFGWSDLGAWGSLYQESTKDGSGNVIHANECFLTDTYNSFIRAPKGKLVVVGGMDEVLIIDEQDVLLVYPKGREQEIKELRQQVKTQFGDRFL